MFKVMVYSFLLVAGMILSLLADLTPYTLLVNTVTMICLAYIMIEVGLEFVINKKKLSSYGKDYFVAATTAAFPWIFCTLYFYWVFGSGYRPSLLVGRFAAPTSAGILFTMLAAIGLSKTWIFKKARILAIFDDLDTILLMIPLQILLIGMRWEILIILPISLLLLWLAYAYLHRVPLPANNLSILIYGAVLALIVEWIRHSTLVQIEVLLPAFVLGCMLKHKKSDPLISVDKMEESKVPLKAKGAFYLDAFVKLLFMFLVGASLPAVSLGGMSIETLGLHVLAITLLSNLGKLFPIFFYKNESTLRQRFALCVAMFPRGEVGAGVLLVGISYGIGGASTTVAVLSLALNLLLTGPFIWLVTKITAQEAKLKKV